jgi:hypothetical protein
VPTPEQLDDEARRLRQIRHLVDMATSLIAQSSMSRDEAENLVAFVRGRVLMLFPDDEGTYELIYAPRFSRLIEEISADSATRRGVLIDFPAPHP